MDPSDGNSNSLPIAESVTGVDGRIQVPLTQAELARLRRSRAASQSWKPTPARAAAFERNVLGARGRRGDYVDEIDQYEPPQRRGGNREYDDRLRESIEALLAEREEEKRMRANQEKEVRRMEKQKMVFSEVERRIPSWVAQAMVNILGPSDTRDGPHAPSLGTPLESARRGHQEERIEQAANTGGVAIEAPPAVPDTREQQIQDWILGRR